MAKFVLYPDIFTSGIRTLSGDDRNFTIIIKPDKFNKQKCLYWSGQSVTFINHREVGNLTGEVWVFPNLEELTECFRLFQLTVPSFPPEKYVKARKQLLNKLSKPEIHEFVYAKMHECIPPKIYGAELLRFCQAFSDMLGQANYNYWKMERESIPFFVPVSLNIPTLRSLLNDPKTTQHSNIRAFIYPFGETSPYLQFSTGAQYTRSKTITGRLTSKTDASILTLKKEYRKIFQSRWAASKAETFPYLKQEDEEGTLWSFDYTSLEPRILLILSEMVKKNPHTTPLIGSLPRHTLTHTQVPDIYLKVLEDLGLSEKLPRAAAKNAILAVLYGQNEENTASQVGKYISKPEDFVKSLLDYFGVPLLRQTLSRDLLYSNRNTITSYYGRPIHCEDTRPSVLLNYYVQATAVDAALFGFNKIINRLSVKGLNEKIMAVFCIHDALVLDIENSYKDAIPKIEQLGSIGLLGFEEVNFYLRAQEFLPTAISVSSENESNLDIPKTKESK